MAANTDPYCGYIPGGADLPLVGEQSPDAYFADAPNSAEINDLINKYRDMAIHDSAALVDRPLLNQNTADLNKFIAEEELRINYEIGLLESGNTSPFTNSTGFPSDLEDLKNTGAIYNADDPNKPLGLKRPTKPGKTPFENLYPNLKDRLNKTPFITQAETQDFIYKSNFTPGNFKGALTKGRYTTLEQLDFYYSPSNWGASSMGSFCSLVADVFALVNSAVDAFDNVKGFIAQIQSFLADPVGMTFKLSEAAVAQMKKMLQEQILTVIDQMAQGAIQKINQFTGGFVNGDFLFNQGSLMENIIREKEKALSFFSKESMTNLKERIKGAIEYAAGVFERMDLEEIQFLIMRFCEIITALETLFTGRTLALSNIQSQYEFARAALSSQGNLATSRAIQAGAIRYDPPTRYELQNRQTAIGASGPIDSSPNAAPGAQVPGEARGVPANVDPISPEEIGQIPSFEEIMSGGNPYIRFPGGLGGMGAEGWSGAKTENKVMLIRLAKLWGSPLPINSAYRSPAYNKSVGGAPNSEHIAGHAFDVAITSSSFINMARSVGFTGFGFYGSFTHIDTGRPRTWNG